MNKVELGKNNMQPESPEFRGARILGELKTAYPQAYVWDFGGTNTHFICEVEPVSEHPEYERVVEVIITSRPHYHHKMKQWYTILKGTLKLTVDEEAHILNPGDKYTVNPKLIHMAESVGDTECWAQIYSEPGWTQEDHIWA